jgi:hypothetical protein
MRVFDIVLNCVAAVGLSAAVFLMIRGSVLLNRTNHQDQSVARRQR